MPVIAHGSKKLSIRLLLGAALALLLAGCAGHSSLPPEPAHWVYETARSDGAIAQRWAPAFVAYDHDRIYNRIGRPVVDQQSGQDIIIDTRQPTVYFIQRTFATDRGVYTNLIYRVHFPEVPYSLIPFNLTAGKNGGLLVVVTLNADELPVLVTTVHTCGCYLAIIPTRALPHEALPAGWTGDTLDVYGERLPAFIDFGQHHAPRLLIHLRPATHRVMDLTVVEEASLANPPFQTIPMEIEAMDQLQHLPAGEGDTSFYFSEGVMQGHVKGSIKPWETLLLSLVSMDLFVGSDKAYEDTSQRGTPFYTSLKFWRRDDSNMWNFPRFLQYWGWRL
ncbi:MAG: hypothetical protein P4L42_01495 [Desulfocapsaceae bacterium]|nr:hypothetical protein [Desulfocapsaceae bacterium]